MLVLLEKMGVEEHPIMEICMHKVEQAHALMALEEMRNYVTIIIIILRVANGSI